MNLFAVITLLVVLSAVFGYINTRFLRLPQTIGLMFMALVFSMLMLLLNSFLPNLFHFAEDIVAHIDFREVLLDVMLSFLLFAGALHTDISLLRSQRRSIILFSFVGVILSTFFIGSLLYYALQLIGQPIGFVYCLLFGALISPTDPIAVLGILAKSKVPKNLEINIVGESLFNDGIGVVIFISILDIIRSGEETFHAGRAGWLLMQEAGGGILFGLVLGYLMFYLLRSIDDYETEVIITLAGVMGGYLLANRLHISGPLAMVTAGLFTGSRAKAEAMSETTELYVDKFWELVDVLMNAILFVLIGLRLMLLDFNWKHLLAGLLAIPLVLIARYLSMRIPLLMLQKWVEVDRKATVLMTWGGLRGGLSIAMALSLARTDPKEIIVFITYIVVLFSIMVQGLTLERLVKRLYRPVTQEQSIVKDR
ncbi:MAG: sodium:proton antiporter [Flavisolibacter sp.]|nr:sodium:proton antiporter [Flavisolibacter sp.]MBD0350180.1 sodium:proton antiporter [Flavisolibacter sp.]MBD0376855.1 sodium:proton antiporter [Flavisolibacter sp.]